MPKDSRIPPKADHLTFPEWDGKTLLFPSADAIHDAILAYGGKIDPYAQYRFVDHNSSEAGRDGSLAKPYKTFAEANIDITDASASKPYQLLVFPGTYGENIALQPHISIRGVSRETVTIQGNLSLSQPGNVALQDLVVNGALTINSAGFPSASAFNLSTVDVYGAVTITGRGAGSDTLHWHDVRLFSNFAMTGTAFTVTDSTFFGNFGIGTGGSVASGSYLLAVNARACYVNTLAIVSQIGESGFAQFTACSIPGTTAITNNGTLVVEFDVPSWPRATFNVTGAPTVNRLNQAVNRFSVAGGGTTAVLWQAHKDLVRAVQLLFVIEHPAANEYSSVILHAVHNGVTPKASETVVGDKQIQVNRSVLVAGNLFQVFVTNNEASPVILESRVIDI